MPAKKNVYYRILQLLKSKELDGKIKVAIINILIYLDAKALEDFLAILENYLAQIRDEKSKLKDNIKGIKQAFKEQRQGLAENFLQQLEQFAIKLPEEEKEARVKELQKKILS